MNSNNKSNKYLDLARITKKAIKHESKTVVPIVIGALGTFTKGLVRMLEELEIGG